MDREIRHLKRDISYIKHKLGSIDELKVGQARLEILMEEMKNLAKDAGKHRKTTEGKTEKTEPVFGVPQSR